MSTEHIYFVKEIVNQLCSQLKDEAVGIIDAIAPPEAVIGSPFAAEDGDVYSKYLQ